MDTRPSRKGPKPANLVQAIERASMILDVLSQHPNGLKLGDVAERVALSKGTTHRILSSLTYLDFVRKEPIGWKYLLGFKLVALGNLLLNQIDLRNVARAYLLDLAERVQETVHLVVRDYDEALYIDKVELHPMRTGLQMVSHLGLRIPMHCCAVGKVILAHLPEKTVDRIIASRGLPPRTPQTITEERSLKAHLQQIRKDGYAVDDEENERGIRCVGAPIFEATGKVAAAISISGPAARITLEEIKNGLSEAVCRIARNISGELGFRE